VSQHRLAAALLVFAVLVSLGAAQGQRPPWVPGPPPSAPPPGVGAPEFDASGLGAAVVLLLGGTAIILSRRRRQSTV
jgi:hypothetical protein